MNELFDTIIVAAGSGTRLGFSLPKAFVPLHNKPLLSYSLNQFLSHRLTNKVILVVPQNLVTKTEEQFGNEHIVVTAGGEYRWMSVYNGVRCAETEWILVHDAARPFVNHKIIDELVDKRNSFDCAITVTPEVDTIRTYADGKAKKTIDRSNVVRVGTPQLFRRSVLARAFEMVPEMETVPTDEAMLMERIGIDVGIAWGDPLNFKVTTPSDFKIAEALIEKSKQVCMGTN